VRSHVKATTVGSTERRSPGRRGFARLAIVLSALVPLALLLAPSSALAVEHPLLETFGSANQPSFVGAQGMAVDQSTGDVLVIDGNEEASGLGSLSRWHKDGTPSNFSALGTNVIGGFTFSFSAMAQVAVDNSGGPTDGNIYVAQGSGGIKVFDQDGNSLGELTESSEGPLGSSCGVAVDGDGSIYVGDLSGAIHKYEPAANPPINGDSSANFPFAGACALAAGAGPTDGFIFASEFFGKVSKLNSTTGAEAYEVTANPVVTLSVDPSTGHLYAPTFEEAILQLNVFGPTEAVQVSSTSPGKFTTGVAVNGSTGDFYAAYGAGGANVEVFGPLSGKHPLLETFGSANQPSFVGAQGMAVDQSTGDVLVIDGNEEASGLGSLSRWHKDGTPSNFSALGTNVIGGFTFSFSAMAQVAVDNSGGPTDGNIYVAQGSGGIKVFDQDGNSLGELTESSEGPLGSSCGVAVDGDGSIYVGDLSGAIHKYEPAANPPINGDSSANFPFAGACALAAGAGPTDGFIFASEFFGKVSKLNSTTGAEAYEVTANPVVTLSVDPSTGHLYAPTFEEAILQLNVFGPTEAVQVSSTSPGKFTTGVAVNGSTGDFYAAYGAGGANVEVFGPLSYVSPPSATTEPASAVTAVTATLNGTVNPSSSAITDCHFEYTDHADFLANGFANATDAPCVPNPGSGSTDIAVQADVSGLSAGTAYDFRLLATNANGTAEGEAESFTTDPAVKDLTTNPATAITQSTATLNGSLDPDGIAITDCHFEYTDHADFLANGFANATDAPCVPPPGSGSGAVSVSADISSLSAATAYDFRLVATNANGTTSGSAKSLTTLSVAITDPATVVHHTSAVLNGHVDPDGVSALEVTDCYFEWGTTTAYGDEVDCNEGDSFAVPSDVSANLGFLTPATTIHFRLHVDTAGAGEFTGADESFTPSLFPTDPPTEVATFGSDGTSATTFGSESPRTLAFDSATQSLYASDKGAPGIYGFDASSPPTYTQLPGFAPLATVATGNLPRLAVDNTALGSAGNLYYSSSFNGGTELIYGFDSNGAPLGGNFPIDVATNPGGSSGSPKSVFDVAVDNSGNLWVANLATKHILRYSSAGVFQDSVNVSDQAPGQFEGPAALAFDSNNDLYTVIESSLWKYTAASGYSPASATKLTSVEGLGLAVDPSAGRVYLPSSNNKGAFVRAYDLSGHHLYDFAAGIAGANFGFGGKPAVDTNTGDVYVPDRGNQKIRVFRPGPTQKPPTITPQDPTAISGDSATLNAKVDPETFEVTDCHFEYGLTTSYGQSAPCDPDPGSGSGDVEVSADLAGLNGGSTYHFRIVAANAEPGGTATGSDQIFTTPGPAIRGESAAPVTETEATINGEINPNGKATSFHVEYLTEAQFLANGYAEAKSVPAPPEEIGSGAGFFEVSQPLTDLTPDTTYHFRLVATNPSGTHHGAGGSFTTFPQTPPGLPDGRAYEMVSPSLKLGEVFPPEPVGNLGGSCEECLPGINNLAMPMQAAPDGESVLYMGQPFSGGLAAGSNGYIADRASSGWSTQSLSSPITTGRYQAFSSDLSRGVLAQRSPALSPEAPTKEGKSFENLYLREEDGSLQPLITEEPPKRSPVEFETRFAGANAGTASEPAFGHLAFEANDALTDVVPGIAPAAPEVEAFKNPAAEECNVQGVNCNLYEWAGGQLRLVNVLPGNASAAANAVAGSGRLLATNDFSDVDHAISDDGSRIFWSSEETGHVYVRVDGEETLEVPGPGSCKKSLAVDARVCFLTASPDGSSVLLSNGQIYELNEAGSVYELASDLAEGQGGFKGILGATEDLSRVYFIDTKALTEASEENANGEHAEAGKLNLYAWDEGTPTFIGILAESDNVLGTNDRYGAWKASLQHRTAQVSADGSYLAFMSMASLSGYDNGSAFEVFVYSADSETLSCASCNPSGQRPLGPSNLSLIRPVGPPFPQPGNLSADGSGRLFFESLDVLSPRDLNGSIQDVYEWEPNGVGDCKREAGCISLISSGESPNDSMFLDATPSGNDAFFITREQLLLRDKDEQLDLYDARVNGGIAEDTTPPCNSGESCLGPLSSAPEQPGPASSSFVGPGNEKAKKQKKKKKHRKHKKSHHKRAAKHNRGGQK
jgi:hypothetical protein